jgi:hypothetical protein
MGLTSGNPRKARASSGVQSTFMVIFILHRAPASRGAVAPWYQMALDVEKMCKLPRLYRGASLEAGRARLRGAFGAPLSLSRNCVRGILDEPG